MTLFENPLQLARQVSELHRAVTAWQRRLRQGDIDDSGPFIGKPEITERDAFRVISELSTPPSIKMAWTRWAFLLTEVRVNARLLAAMARAYRVDRHQIEHPKPIALSLSELVQRMLCRPSERLLWAEPLAARTTRLRRLAIEVVVRRDEIARRAGFSNAYDLTAPAQDLPGWAERMLVLTDDLYRESVPPRLDRWFDAALAISADQGWPAQLTASSVERIVGGREWLDGLDVKPRDLPSPLAASSFARALSQFGAAVVQASTPQSEPFILARDPYGLYRRTVGSLFAHLTTSPIWQASQLSLSRTRAREQAQAMLTSELIHARTMALAICLWERARQGSGGFERDFEDLCHRAIGFVLPRGFAGVIPRLRVDAGQRLLGPWIASRWTHDLVAQFDEDWYMNPRGIESVRDRLSRVLPVSVGQDELAACLDAFVEQFSSLL